MNVTLKRQFQAAAGVSLGLLMAGRAAAQAPASAQPPPAPPGGSTSAPVRVGVLLFGGIGPSKYNNVDKGLQALEARFATAGFTSVSGSMTNRAGVGHAGGGVTFGFGQSPVGVSATVRGGNNTGPAMSALASRTTPAVTTNVSSEYDHFRFIGLSIGAPINIGRAVLVEPMLDLTKWKTKNTTFENVNGATTTTTVDRSGSDPGFGLRAAWFPTRVLGFGYELHIIKLNDVAPGLAAAPWQAFLEDSQSFFSVYVRWKQ